MGCVTAHQAITVLEHNATYLASPEARLWFAVIGQAVRELCIAHRANAAWQFIASPGFDGICEQIGLGADMAREVIAKVGAEIPEAA